MTLLETLRALAPVVTPGEWIASDLDQSAQIWSSACGYVGETRDYHGNDATAIVTLRNALPELIAALEVVDLVRDEDWLAERISDTLDMDWRPIDAARAIIAALPKDEV